jgi:hypothetical protein
MLLVKPPVIQAHDVAVLQLLQHGDLAQHACTLLAAAAPAAAQKPAMSAVTKVPKTSLRWACLHLPKDAATDNMQLLVVDDFCRGFNAVHAICFLMTTPAIC